MVVCVMVVVENGGTGELAGPCVEVAQILWSCYLLRQMTTLSSPPSRPPSSPAQSRGGPSWAAGQVGFAFLAGASVREFTSPGSLMTPPSQAVPWPPPQGSVMRGSPECPCPESIHKSPESQGQLFPSTQFYNSDCNVSELGRPITWMEKRA